MSTCIQCKRKPAKWFEQTNIQNKYCGRICQKEYHYLIGLKGNDNIIGLEASDGTRITLTLDQARKIDIVESLLDMYGADRYLLLSELDGRTLNRFKEFLTKEKLTNVSDAELISLLRAIDFVGCESFLYYLIPQWVNQKYFPNDLVGLYNYISDALYFFKGDFNTLTLVEDDVKTPFINFIKKYGENQWPIKMAAKDGRLKVINRLLEMPDVDPTTSRNYPIRAASAEGHLQVVNRLLEIPNVDATAADNSAIELAARHGHSRVVNRLLDANVPADIMILIYAARDGSLDIVNRLLGLGINPADSNNRAIVVAAEKGHLNVVNRLLEIPQVDPTADDNAALFGAVLNKHLHIIKRLLDDGRVKLKDLKRFDESLYQQFASKK